MQWLPCSKQTRKPSLVVTLPSLSVIYHSLRDKHAALITQVSSPSLHELMSTNIRSFHAHFSIGTLCLLKSVSSTRCLQASQLIWSTKPWHSGGKGRRYFAEERKGKHTTALLVENRFWHEIDTQGHSRSFILQSIAGQQWVALQCCWSYL